MPESSMPESSLPESKASDANPAALSHSPSIGPKSVIEILSGATEVAYVACWEQNANQGPQIVDTVGTAGKVTLQQRQRCLTQVFQKPSQPFLLGDQSKPSSETEQKALLCMLAATNGAAEGQLPQVFEIQFHPATSMQQATASLQQSAKRLQEAGWKIGGTKQKSPANPSSKFEFSGQAIPPSFSAGGLGHSGHSSSKTTNDQTAEALRNLSRHVHRSLDPLETDMNVCNELVNYLDCDRVSIVRQQRGQYKVHAVSGQTSVNQRSKVVQQLQALASATLRQGKAFYAPSDEALPKEISQPLDSFLLSSDVRSVAIVPISAEANELKQEEADLRKEVTKDTVVAGIIIESLKREIDFRKHPNLQPAIEVSGDAIRNSFQHHNLLFYPLWHWLGHTRVVAWSRRVPLSIIAGLILLLIAALAFWPATFYVSSDGVLVPENRDRIFAPLNGLVEEVYVKPNQTVTAGQPLIRMRDYDLESQLQKVRRDLAVTTSQIQIQERWIRTGNQDERFVNREDEMPLSVLMEQRKNLELQMKLLEQQKQLLLVASPIDGTVMTWRVNEELLQRPVPFGRLMMEIAEVDGQWKLQLNLPDRRIGHLLEAIEQSENPLKVEFVLAARPEQRYYGTLNQVALTTGTSQEDGAYVQVEVTVDSDDLQVLQNETEVSAKILCGRASLGYVWLHDITEYCQKKIFFFTW